MSLNLLPFIFQCGPNYKMLKFEWRNNQISHLYPPPYTGCIGGCDTSFLEMLRINLSSVRQVAERTQNSNITATTVNRSQNSRPSSNSNSPSTITPPIPVVPSIPSAAPRPNIAQPRQFVPPPVANRVPNPTNNQPRMPLPRSDNNDDNHVLCGCNKPAIVLTVRKQTPNFGNFVFSLIF